MHVHKYIHIHVYIICVCYMHVYIYACIQYLMYSHNRVAKSVQERLGALGATCTALPQSFRSATLHLQCEYNSIYINNIRRSSTRSAPRSRSWPTAAAFSTQMAILITHGPSASPGTSARTAYQSRYVNKKTCVVYIRSAHTCSTHTHTCLLACA